MEGSAIFNTRRFITGSVEREDAEGKVAVFNVVATYIVLFAYNSRRFRKTGPPFVISSEQGERLTMETVQNDKQTKARIRQTGIRSVVDLDIGQAPEELLTVLLHDLRSPLGAIGVLVELLTTNAETGSSPDPRQMAMLQEAVVKAQRIMDDAVEIQSVLRGSSSFTPCVIEMETVVQNSIEKAAHAPYFREVNVQYDTNGGSQLIKVDVEKAESALLCALEQSVAYVDRPLTLRIYHSHANGFANLHIANDRGKGTGEPVIADRRALSGMNGRLGTRRLGESRFNLLLASKVLQLMGGALDHRITAKGRFINLQFPLG